MAGQRRRRRLAGPPTCELAFAEPKRGRRSLPQVVEAVKRGTAAGWGRQQGKRAECLAATSPGCAHVIGEARRCKGSHAEGGLAAALLESSSLHEGSTRTMDALATRSAACGDLRGRSHRASAAPLTPCLSRHHQAPACAAARALAAAMRAMQRVAPSLAAPLRQQQRLAGRPARQTRGLAVKMMAPPKQMLVRRRLHPALCLCCRRRPSNTCSSPRAFRSTCRRTHWSSIGWG